MSQVDPGMRRHTEGGFVLAFVVFMLFAISIAGATGYMVVSSEWQLARHSSDGAEALTVARAGLERFVAEQIGVVDDTVSYALGRGVAVVTSRMMYAKDSVTDMYYIRSEATVDDILSPNTPARRVVSGYATHRRRPLAHHATVMMGSDVLEVTSGGEAHGFDYDNAGTCPGGGATTITGAIAGTSVLESQPTGVQGSPESEIWSGGWAEIQDSVGLRWDVLSDPDFPVEFENTLPDFGAIPADSFPLIRFTGWTFAWWSGRGVLIVDGIFYPLSSFSWDGIIIARDVYNRVQGDIDGMLIVGMDGPNMTSSVELRADVNYHSCYVYAANETLSYLELMPNTVHESN